MRKLFMSLVVIIGLAGAAQAQNAEIEATIGGQIEAFLVDDFDRAFSFASPNIQRVFRTPENFGAMVKGGYPMVWRPSNVRFLELREISGAVWQKVMITDGKGRAHILDYQMIEQESGWKINAVQVLDSSGASA